MRHAGHCDAPTKHFEFRQLSLTAGINYEKHPWTRQSGGLFTFKNCINDSSICRRVALRER
jgi:hypothetical protein